MQTNQSKDIDPEILILIEKIRIDIEQWTVKNTSQQNVSKEIPQSSIKLLSQKDLLKNIINPIGGIEEFLDIKVEEEGSQICQNQVAELDEEECLFNLFLGADKGVNYLT
jgi:hypothetical protein